MAYSSTVTFDCTVGDLHADYAVAVWALLSLYQSQESLLLSKLHCPLPVEGGYGCGPTVLLVSLPPKNQANQGPSHHIIPIIVTRQSRFVTRHKYPSIHSPSQALKAISAPEVHPWVCISKCVLFLFLTSVLLCASV